MMAHAKTLPKVLLGIGTIGIYVISLFVAYVFSRNYSHLSNFSLVFGVITIILCGEGCAWLLFLLYNRYRKPKKGPIADTSPAEEAEKKIASAPIIQKKQDRKIQKNYLAILAEYKKTLAPREYKKFQEDTRYDILLYDAIMVSRDKQGMLLDKIRQEKGEFYANTVKRILE